MQYFEGGRFSVKKVIFDDFMGRKGDMKIFFWFKQVIFNQFPWHYNKTTL